jgi:Rrf2 family protein
MLELALNYGGKPVLMRHIAEKQEISRKYLHALLTSLKSAGLVRSVRGSGGGYLLAHPPSRIHVDQVGRGPLCL